MISQLMKSHKEKLGKRISEKKWSPATLRKKWSEKKSTVLNERNYKRSKWRLPCPTGSLRPKSIRSDIKKSNLLCAVNLLLISRAPLIKVRRSTALSNYQ
ncbi:hypothetical protein CDAR_237331 [Caerostris darwini]|uniref:Uncharacterized protein n=1 Tax=Caerostris darwini TaxID=1538125 RepID=A0AAV4QQ65_9ARAC|nr:hypothetical protein CDAR_237331 [Caerostris darwini]